MEKMMKKILSCRHYDEHYLEIFRPYSQLIALVFQDNINITNNFILYSLRRYHQSTLKHQHCYLRIASHCLVCRLWRCSRTFRQLHLLYNLQLVRRDTILNNFRMRKVIQSTTRPPFRSKQLEAHHLLLQELRERRSKGGQRQGRFFTRSMED